MQVMAILDRIKRQDAGEIEPPAIALAGEVGANPASEDFLEQSARASRQSAAGTDDAAAEVEGGEADLEDFEEVSVFFLGYALTTLLPVRATCRLCLPERITHEHPCLQLRGSETLQASLAEKGVRVGGTTQFIEPLHHLCC